MSRAMLRVANAVEPIAVGARCDAHAANPPSSQATFGTASFDQLRRQAALADSLCFLRSHSLVASADGRSTQRMPRGEAGFGLVLANGEYLPAGG